MSSHLKYCRVQICNMEVITAVGAVSALHQECLSDNLFAYVD
jgi:hypothetical protein